MRSHPGKEPPRGFSSPTHRRLDADARLHARSTAAQAPSRTCTVLMFNRPSRKIRTRAESAGGMRRDRSRRRITVVRRSYTSSQRRMARCTHYLRGSQFAEGGWIPERRPLPLSPSSHVSKLDSFPDSSGDTSLPRSLQDLDGWIEPRDWTQDKPKSAPVTKTPKVFPFFPTSCRDCPTPSISAVVGYPPTEPLN